MSKRREEIVSLIPSFKQSLEAGVRIWNVKPKSKMVREERWISLENETPEAAINNIRKVSEGLEDCLIFLGSPYSLDRDGHEPVVVGWRPWTEEEDVLFTSLLKEKKELETNRDKFRENEERETYERLKKKFEGQDKCPQCRMNGTHKMDCSAQRK